MKKKIKNNLSVMILCGGRGERLKPITNNLPKPLIKIKKREILSHIIDHIKSYNLKNIPINTKIRVISMQELILKVQIEKDNDKI